MGLLPGLPGLYSQRAWGAAQALQAGEESVTRTNTHTILCRLGIGGKREHFEKCPSCALRGTWLLLGGLFFDFVYASMKFVQSLKIVNLTAAISVRACELESGLGVVFA